MTASIPLCKMLIEKDIEKDIEKERKHAAKAAGLSFVLDRDSFQKFLKLTSNSTLEDQVHKLTMETQHSSRRCVSMMVPFSVSGKF